MIISKNVNKSIKTLQNAKKSVDKFAKSDYIINRVCKTQTERSDILFKNLEAEQARNGLTNTDVATLLGISRVSYESKKKTGKFTTSECKILCKTFKCKFDYLFETE